MKKILLAVVTLVAIGTATFEKLRAYPLTYCLLSCQDCWITWNPNISTFSWGAEIMCSAAQINTCHYSISLRMWDNGTSQYWTAGTSGWTGCNDSIEAVGQTAAPLALQHGHSYVASITVLDATDGSTLCYDTVSFWWP